MVPPSDYPHVNHLERPVIGLESEFCVFVDGVETAPENLWRTPQDFVADHLLPRSKKSSQLPGGGAAYFDGGVLELVTPVVELAPQCTGRVVRNMWEQIGYVRQQLDGYEQRTGKAIRLAAFSCHVNLSFELTREERSSDRTVQKLALLLAMLLPLPVIVLGANRESTGIGVRPRRDRIEITLDFTPDPGLMAATVALIAGIARAVIAWPSYRVDELAKRGIAIPRHLVPGKHPTRNGWVARAAHMGRDPFASDLDTHDWELSDGTSDSIRGIARRVAMYFADSIRELADGFSVRLLFSVLRGETRALLDLPERPAEYDDIGRATRWGTALDALDHYAGLLDGHPDSPRRRHADIERLAPPWRGAPDDRRSSPAAVEEEHRADGDRRRSDPAQGIWPELSRSEYEMVFIRAAKRVQLRIDDEVLDPVACRGWYHVEFRNAEGQTRQLSIDQIIARGTWAS